MHIPDNLTGLADAISAYANIRENLRLGSSNRALKEAHLSAWEESNSIFNMETARGQVWNLIIESLAVAVKRPSELEARLRIVNDGVRTLGLDHPVVAQAASALAGDMTRLSKATAE